MVMGSVPLLWAHELDLLPVPVISYTRVLGRNVPPVGHEPPHEQVVWWFHRKPSALSLGDCRSPQNGVAGGPYRCTSHAQRRLCRHGSADNYEHFTDTAAQLDKQEIAYIAVLDGFGFGYHGQGRLVTAIDIKKGFNGSVMASSSYTRDIAEGAVRSGAVDAVCFARPFISNPDLVARFRHNWLLEATAPYDEWWQSSKGAEGYTPYPAYAKKEE